MKRPIGLAALTVLELAPRSDRLFPGEGALDARERVRRALAAARRFV